MQKTSTAYIAHGVEINQLIELWILNPAFPFRNLLDRQELLAKSQGFSRYIVTSIRRSHVLRRTVGLNLIIHKLNFEGTTW